MNRLRELSTIVAVSAGLAFSAGPSVALAEPSSLPESAKTVLATTPVQHIGELSLAAYTHPTARPAPARAEDGVARGMDYVVAGLTVAMLAFAGVIYGTSPERRHKIK